ncbi:MAG: hypothetical protein OXI86_17305, partial [Candidatus Poribacteria bacterium]|nr:hypothetical protein [Candidatus Poribacteria bacterium]
GVLDGAPEVQVGDFNELGLSGGTESEQQDDGKDVSRHWGCPLYRVDTALAGPVERCHDQPGRLYRIGTKNNRRI